MDNRQHADNKSQFGPPQPQRRMFVYDRPFAASGTSQPAPQPVRSPVFHETAPKPVVAPPAPPPAATIRQQNTKNHHTGPLSMMSIDGVLPVRSTPQPPSQPMPPKQPLVPANQQQQIRPVSAPPQTQTNYHEYPALFQQNNEQIAQQPIQSAPTQSSSIQPAPITNEDAAYKVYVELPDEAAEKRKPINTPQQSVATNQNWHPVQQPREGSWMASAAQEQLGFEQQLQQNAKNYRPGFFARLRGLVPLGLKLTLALVVIGGVVGGFSMVRSGHVARTVSDNFNQAEADDLGIFNTQPSESPQTGTLGVSKTADAPKAVSIDAIDMTARVVTVGTSRNSFIKSPANIYDIGWYEGSGKPGQKGVVLLNGHISGPTRPGALYEVALLKRGDSISVERGDGKIFNYTVQAVEFFENDQIDMSKMLTPYNPNRNGLNIMTAGGRFNTETNAYELRAAVYAVEDIN